MTEERKADTCPNPDCIRMGRCAAPFFDAICHHAAIAVSILAADKEPPEASFDNVDDMLAYLNDTPPRSP